MYVVCSTLCFGKLKLEDALRHIREMHFAKADLAIHHDGPHLTPADVARDPAKVAQKLRASNLGFAGFHLTFAELDGPAVRDQLRAVCKLARMLAVPLVTVLAAPTGHDQDAEVERLTAWRDLVQADGLLLCVETAAGTLAGDAAGAVELCKRVPGLGLTLDPSYFVTPPAAGTVDPLYPYVRHVRMRDTGAKAEQFQVRIGQGEIEYGKVIGNLDRFQYDRALAVDVRDTVPCEFPVAPEVRKLKYLLESLV
jgi:sugar phosphate isomerase/epimerase